MTVLLALMVILAGRVRDVQAHLITMTTVVERFGNLALGCNAKDVEQLFAEWRRLAMSRVIFSRTEARVRRFK